MYSAFFQGVSPVLPLLILTILALLSVAVAYFSYRDLTKGGPVKKWALIALRSSSLIILILLLLNPFLTFETSTTETPQIAVYFDNSSSVSLERGNYSGLDDYQSWIDQFRDVQDDRFNYSEYLFDTEIYSDESLQLNGSGTHLNAVVNHILENENQVTAAVLFSDGIATQGRNPIFTSSDLSIPVFTVPLGDTTTVRDISVANVNFNDPVYTNTVNRITAEIQYQQAEGERTEVRLIENGVLIESKEIELQTASGSQQIEFNRQYSEAGFKELAVEVTPIENEFTTENNRFEFSTDVLDDKSRILSITYEIHPDVAAIRNQIATDIQNELITSTWIGREQFADTDPFSPDIDIDDIDLIILHGKPPAGSDVTNQIDELIEQKPLLTFTLPSSFSGESDLNSSEIITYQNLQSPIDIRPVRLSADLTHPLLELTIPPERSLPALTAHQGIYTVAPSGQILLTANFQGTATDIPVLVSDEGSNLRQSSINAYGWYQYRLSNQDQTVEFFKSLIDNLVSWTSTPPDRRRLIIEPTQNQFTENESVQLRGTLFNERGETEPNGLIEVRLIDTEEEVSDRTFRMTNTNSETYTADVGRLPSGVYRAEAVATLNNRELGTDETRIVVGQSNIELLNTRRDDLTLRNIADNSGGLFLENRDFERFNTYLENERLFEEIEEITSTQSYLFQFHYLWFFAVLILLTAEWLIRRSLSMV
jgi:hypothetical protein